MSGKVLSLLVLLLSIFITAKLYRLKKQGLNFAIWLTITYIISLFIIMMLVDWAILVTAFIPLFVQVLALYEFWHNRHLFT